MKIIFILACAVFLIPFSIFSAEKATLETNPQVIQKSAQKASIENEEEQKKISEPQNQIDQKFSNTEFNKIEQLSNENSNFRVAKATEWNAYATIAIAILTIILAFETIRLRRIQAKQIKDLNDAAIKPKIEVFLESNRYSINFLEIHLVNNGNGTANNIEFIFEAEDNEAHEISKIIISKIQNINFFKIGLKYLGAGQHKTSFLMSTISKEFGETKAFFKSSILTTILCEDDFGKKYSYKYSINMSEFQGMRSIGKEPTKEISENIEKISKAITSIVSLSPSGRQRIQTDIYNDDSREEERQEIKEFLEKQKT